MRRGIILIALALWLQIAALANAHFIWIDAQNDGPTPQARIYFNEDATPGNPELLGKVAHTAAWSRASDGSVASLKLERHVEGDAGELVATPEAGPAHSLEARCLYGLFQRGSVAALLQYDAKHLGGNWPSWKIEQRTAAKLKLDIVPEIVAGQLQLRLLFQGKPDPGREVIVVDSQGQRRELKSNEHGIVDLGPPQSGHYAIRAAHREPDAAGEHGGKHYDQTWTYSTLTLDVPAAATEAGGDSSPKTSGTTNGPTAREVLRQARDGRALWRNFPGFKAAIEVTAGGERLQGSASIDSGGSVEVDLPDEARRRWVEEQLSSLVQHRMPDGEVSTGKVTFTEIQDPHPLGRQIDLGDPDLGSRYRIQDGVILEVSRKMGPLRFVISVMEIARDPEGNYLPRTFTMNFFDAATGQLRKSVGYRNDWQRVGNFDLPATILEMSTDQGMMVSREIKFANYVLLERKTDQ